MGRLDGKVALVTGGTNGIGKEIVKRFAAEGASVAFCGRDKKAGSAIEAERMADTMPVSFTQCDVTDENAVLNWVDDVALKSGRIDIVVANAGRQSRQTFLTASFG